MHEWKDRQALGSRGLGGQRGKSAGVENRGMDFEDDSSNINVFVGLSGSQ